MTGSGLGLTVVNLIPGALAVGSERDAPWWGLGTRWEHRSDRLLDGLPVAFVTTIVSVSSFAPASALPVSAR